MKSLGIASAAFAETVRQPVYSVLILAGSALLFLSSWVTLFGFGQEAQIVRETGIAGAVVGGLFIVFLTVPGALAEEIRSKQLLAVLAKPVSGFDLVAGKFLGLCAALAVAFAVFGVAFGASLYLEEGGLWAGALASAMFLGFLQVAAVGALVMLFSVILPVPAAAVAGFALYAAGNLIPYLSRKLEAVEGVGRALGEFLLLWIPDLFRLNASFDFAAGRTPSLLYLLYAGVYSGCYALLILWVAGRFLTRKEMT